MSRIQIKFSKYLPPLLNSKEGYIECFIDSVSTYCESISNRRIQIFLTKSITALTYFEIQIHGVTQSSSSLLTTSELVKLYVVKNGSYFDNVIEYFKFSEVAVTSSLSTTSIVSASISPKIVRNKITHTINAVLPKNAVYQDSSVFIDLIGMDYALLWTPSCSIVRTDDTSLKNWVKSCSFLDSRRLQIIFASTDVTTSSSSKEY